MVLQSSECGDFHCVWRKDGLVITPVWRLHCVWRTDGLAIISVWRLPLCVKEEWPYNHISVETPIVCGGRMVLQSYQYGDFHLVWRKDGLTIISMWRLPLCVEEGSSYNHLSVETPIVCGGRMVLQSSQCVDFYCV